jgi:hypothetical protein
LKWTAPHCCTRARRILGAMRGARGKLMKRVSYYEVVELVPVEEISV